MGFYHSIAPRSVFNNGNGLSGPYTPNNSGNIGKMGNQRLFYACEAIGIAPQSSTSFKTVHGVQSVGISTQFNLIQVFELGQLNLYDYPENIPNIEVTMERVLDGYPLAYDLATHNAPSQSLVGRSAQQCNIAMSLFPDTNGAASGDALFQVTCSGMFVSSLSYSLSVGDNSKENITFVGNNKYWSSGLACTFENPFTGSDFPLATAGGSGGTQRREDVLMGSSYWPKGMLGISTSGTNDMPAGSAKFNCPIQSVNISVDLGRDDLFQLGTRAQYFRYVNFPVEVTTAIEVLSNEQGDYVNAYATPVGGTNVTPEKIYVAMKDGTVFDLGTTNKLQSITFGGGDVGGGNATVTYNYSNFNVLTVSQPPEVFGQD